MSSAIDDRTSMLMTQADIRHLEHLFDERSRLPADDPHQLILRDQLITGYLPLARNVARKHAYRTENVDDLVQDATLGLINAVDRFEPERGANFLSFAIPTMTGEVLRHFRDRSDTIRLPRRLLEEQGVLRQAVAELTHRLGRAPRPTEIAAHLCLDVESVIEAMEAHHTARCSSLDEPSGEGPGIDSRFESVLACTDPETELIELRESLGPLLDALSDRDRRILLLRFFGSMTQSGIAQQVGISQMHVSRVLAATLARLRERLTSEL
jgi:RNA polymerase sigma-B factor